MTTKLRKSTKFRLFLEKNLKFPQILFYCLLHLINTTIALNPSSKIEFNAPLLEYGYKPAVLSESTNSIKPKLLYLPGIGGSCLSSFLQFPELSTIFHIRAMRMDVDDRSTFDELTERTIDYINTECPNEQVYLLGESFGGVLCQHVAEKLSSEKKIKGVVLVNPATSFPNSKLYQIYNQVRNSPPVLYPFLLLFQILPLFTSDQYQLEQLLLILSSKALPSVIDTAAREAYMGRVALSLYKEVVYISRETFLWRLEEWLLTGCEKMTSKKLAIPALLIAGELDQVLPSSDEIESSRDKFTKATTTVIVPGAGHSSTCGSRVDLAAEIRNAFSFEGRTSMKAEAKAREDEYFGMTKRYDGNPLIGLSPLKYWSNEYYLRK